MRRPVLLLYALLCLLVLAVLSGFLLAMTTFRIGTLVGLKEAARTIDASLFGARVLTLYKGERIPSMMPPAPEGAYDWLGNESLLPIAHGLGPWVWGGINTQPTFEEARRRGFRIFEVDLAVTTDGRLVCFHGTDEQELDAMSWQQYVERTHKAGLEPLEFKQLVGWARQDPAIHFVLDVKNRFAEAYRMARVEIGSPALGHSFIPQIYRFDELTAFRADNFFAGEIFTSYRSPLTTATIVATAERLHVQVVTLTMERTARLPSIPSSLTILTHPVDDPLEAARLRARGVRGIYTSYVTPGSAPEVFAPWPEGCRPGQYWGKCNFSGLTQDNR